MSGDECPSQYCTIQLASVVLDRPGRKGVTEAVRVHFGDAGSLPQASEQLLQAVRLERDPWHQHLQMIGGNEEWTGLGSTIVTTLVAPVALRWVLRPAV